MDARQEESLRCRCNLNERIKREATGKDDIAVYHCILYPNDGQVDYAVQDDQERRWRKEGRSGEI